MTTMIMLMRVTMTKIEIIKMNLCDLMFLLIVKGIRIDDIGNDGDNIRSFSASAHTNVTYGYRYNRVCQHFFLL